MNHEEVEIRSNENGDNVSEEKLGKKRSHRKNYEFQQDMVRATSTSKMYVNV